MSKEIDLIKCIIYEIDKNLYFDFDRNLCISYTPDLKKLLLSLNTPEVKHYFDNQDQQIADLQHRLEVAEKALDLACKYNIPDNHITLRFEDGVQVENWQELKEYVLQQAEKELKGE